MVLSRYQNFIFAHSSWFNSQHTFPEINLNLSQKFLLYSFFLEIKNIFACFGHLYCCSLLTMSKPLTVWITINCRKFWKRWEYQTTWPASWETYMQVRKQQLELDMEQQTDWFQIGKGVRQGCILSPCLFNLYAEYIMWNTGLDEHKLESRLQGEISITLDIQMKPPLWQKAKRN